MARMNILLPAMGEGVIEATINKWLVAPGTAVNEDDPLVEVATDKVDSEIPAPAAGIIAEIMGKEGDIMKVGDILAVLETDTESTPEEIQKIDREVDRIRETIDAERKEKKEETVVSAELKSRTPSGKFLSPLVRKIASGENISYAELDTISGTGMDGRITRDDVLKFLEVRKGSVARPAQAASATEGDAGTQVNLADKTDQTEQTGDTRENATTEKTIREVTGRQEDVIVEMDRVRRIIADHMVMSKKVSAHVTSFIDADVTRIVTWRNSIKDKFQATEGQKLTLTPIFIDAAARALYDFPMINVSVDGYKIIMKKNINIGMATALPDGNLIVPVIKNANEKSLTGLAKAVNDLASRARSNRLKPEEISGGTFTVTNFGSYNNLSGTPVINQPQVAILGTGAVRKMPAVIETPDGDMIGIRHIMILSLSYDHRVVDGALAGKFLNRIKEILENYNTDEFLKYS